MAIEYALDEIDFLEHQLFIASKSASVKVQRLKTWMIYIIASPLLGVVFYFGANRVMAYYFFVVGVILLCFFQLYQKGYYKQHYKKFSADTYKNRFGIMGSRAPTKDELKTTHLSGQAKLNATEIENIIETGSYLYMKMKMGSHLIIPKLKLSNVGYVREELKDFCNRMPITFIEELNWKWK